MYFLCLVLAVLDPSLQALLLTHESDRSLTAGRHRSNYILQDVSRTNISAIGLLLDDSRLYALGSGVEVAVIVVFRPHRRHVSLDNVGESGTARF